MPLTTYSRNAALNHVFGGAGVAYTPAATLYLALCTADPTAAATGASMNEVTNGDGYARTAITFGAAASRAVTQSATVTFPALTANKGTATHYAVVDSATYGAGNVLGYGAFAVAKALNPGSGSVQPFVSSGEVVITFTGEASDYLANTILDFMFRNQAFAQPATYIGAATATITGATTGSTVSENGAGGYARVAVNDIGGASPAWSAVSGGALSNANDVSLPTATADWTDITGSFVATASSGGQILFYDNLGAPESVLNGDIYRWTSGNYDVNLNA